MNRQMAFSMLEIKGIDDDQRMITGMATTPEPDRVGDILDPFGAKFLPEIPLLWQHKHDKPVGVAKLGMPSAKGIPFTAVIAKVAEEGELKNLCDYAWQCVKAKLVQGVSVGFLPRAFKALKDGGTHFLESEVYELSLATVPMNSRATIHTIKALNAPAMESGAIRLIHAAEMPRDLNGGIPLSSAARR